MFIKHCQVLQATETCTDWGLCWLSKDEEIWAFALTLLTCAQEGLTSRLRVTELAAPSRNTRRRKSPQVILHFPTVSSGILIALTLYCHRYSICWHRKYWSSQRKYWNRIFRLSGLPMKVVQRWRSISCYVLCMWNPRVQPSV